MSKDKFLCEDLVVAYLRSDLSLSKSGMYVPTFQKMFQHAGISLNDARMTECLKRARWNHNSENARGWYHPRDEYHNMRIKNS